MKKPLLALSLLLIAPAIQGEIVIIGHKNNQAELSQTQVEDIFMGRSHTLPNGRLALPMDQAALRPEFYQKLTTRPIEQINAYWARLVFTGQNVPPAILADDNAVLSMVSQNEDAIGYIDKRNVNNTVRVLLILNGAETNGVYQ